MADSSQKSGGVPSFPVEEILSNVAHSVVEAQRSMDTASLASELRIREQGLDEFGLSAHWYTIPELEFDLQLAFELDKRGNVSTQMVDAEYKSKYGFNVQGSSHLETKIVSTPPAPIEGLSLGNEQAVLQRVGQIKKVVEAYDRSDAPHFLVRYRAFSPQGYDGGLWFALLMDSLSSGEQLLRCLSVLDDAEGTVLRLWTDEPITLSGIIFTPLEAAQTLTYINDSTAEIQKTIPDMDAGIVDTLIAARPFLNLGKASESVPLDAGLLQKFKDAAGEA